MSCSAATGLLKATKLGTIIAPKPSPEYCRKSLLFNGLLVYSFRLIILNPKCNPIIREFQRVCYNGEKMAFKGLIVKKNQKRESMFPMH
jgi:hypothetical protein